MHIMAVEMNIIIKNSLIYENNLERKDNYIEIYHFNGLVVIKYYLKNLIIILCNI